MPWLQLASSILHQEGYVLLSVPHMGPAVLVSMYRHILCVLQLLHCGLPVHGSTRQRWWGWHVRLEHVTPSVSQGKGPLPSILYMYNCRSVRGVRYTQARTQDFQMRGSYLEKKVDLSLGGGGNHLGKSGKSGYLGKSKGPFSLYTMGLLAQWGLLDPRDRPLGTGLTLNGVM